MEVGDRDGVLWREAFGKLDYDEDAAVTQIDTIFDLASLTKVSATTSHRDAAGRARAGWRWTISSRIGFPNGAGRIAST